MALVDLITNPEAFVVPARAWIENNYWLLGTYAVGGLTACAGAGFAFRSLTGIGKSKSHFGGKKQARKANLMRNTKLEFSGIPIGKIGKERLCWIDQEPVLVTGGTRSGKGVGVIRPACLTYGGPMVMYDGGKGELFRDTAGYRSRFSHVLNFDLTNPDGVHFNFLDEVRPEFLVRDVENLVQAIPKPEDSDGHFEPAADEYISAVIIHILLAEDESQKNMTGVLHFISRGDDGARKIVGANAHPVAVSRATSLFGATQEDVNNDDGMKYRNSVYRSARVRLKVFDEDVVAKVTSRSDFRMKDLIWTSPKGKPVSLYLTSPASDDDRLRPLVSMFLAFLINTIMREQPALHGQPRTLLVIDEFASLRMEILQTAITKIVGLGCTMLLGAQSLSALRQKPYGTENQFRDNIRCYIAYAANDDKTAQEIAHACGTVRESRTSYSKTRSPNSWMGTKGESTSEFEKPLITPGDVRAMPDDEELIFVTGQPVMKVNKIRDYEDPILKQRLNLPLPPMRGPDGVYPNLPQPDPKSPWADVPKDEDNTVPDWLDETLPDMADIEPEQKQPKKKRKLVAAVGNGE